ncbi:MAG: aminotransferase class IV [Hyphomonadaceae bacterium]|nr:aminotransferase class IV [Hyphomonadaceae bacterium]
MALPPTRLQVPKWAFYQGEVRPYLDAKFHIASEAVVRGLNVFEGLKGFWQPDGSFGLLALPRHWKRMRQSAKLLHIPFEMSLEEWIDANHAIVEALYEPERNMWIRATLYVTEGHWGENTVSDLVLTAFHYPKGAPQPIHTGVSTWQRATDQTVPYRIKTSTNYQVARLAKIEGRERGYPEMLLLNQHGRLSESIGSAVLVVRDGTILTPPYWEGAIESITVDILEALAQDLGIPFQRRPIDRTELIIADEMAVTGTMNDIIPIASLDGMAFGPQSVLKRLSDRYFAACEGRAPHPAADLSIRPRVVRKD